MTAVRRSEFHSYTEELPSETLCKLGGSEDEVERKRLFASAGTRVGAAGMQKVEEQRRRAAWTSALLHVVVAWFRSFKEPADKLEGGTLWLYRARAYRTQLKNKSFKT